MYRAAQVLILGLILASRAVAQDPDRALTPAERAEMMRRAEEAELQRQEIVNLENEAAHAIRIGNPTFFKRVLSDDFAGTLSHGQSVNKAGFIEIVLTPDVKYASFNATDISIRTYQDTAVATCLWSFSATYRGKPISSQMRVLHVYVNTPRGWRVVASQATALPPDVQQPL